MRDYLTPVCKTDFYGYAILDLIDGTLSKIHTKVIKKQYEGAFHLLEGLTAFQCLEDTFLSGFI